MKCVRAYQRPDFLLWLGDGVAGSNKADKGMGVWTPDLNEQFGACIPLLNAYHAKHVYGVKGSRYHVGDNQLADELILQNLDNAVPVNDRYAPPHRYLEICGAIIHIAHKLGGTRVFQYRGTPISRMLTMNRVMSQQTEVYKANLILRGHVHNYYEVRAGMNSFAATVPCWTAQDDYAAFEEPFVWMPHIGVLLIEICNGKVSTTPVLVDLPEQRPPLEKVR